MVASPVYAQLNDPADSDPRTIAASAVYGQLNNAGKPEAASPVYAQLVDPSGPFAAGHAASPVYGLEDVYVPTNTLPIVEAGAVAHAGPPNVHVVAVAPIAVVLGWDAMSDADLREDEILTNEETDLTGEAGVFPAVVTGNKRVLLGFIVHKDGGGFKADGTQLGEGNVVADWNTLGPTATRFTDLDVTPGMTHYYLVGAVYDDGF